MNTAMNDSYQQNFFSAACILEAASGKVDSMYELDEVRRSSVHA